MRESVIKNFPDAHGLPEKPGDYHVKVEEIYVTDAYHSLSIEPFTDFITSLVGAGLKG